MADCNRLEQERNECVSAIHHAIDIFNATGFSNSDYVNNKLKECRGFALELSKGCPDTNIAVIEWNRLKY